MIEPSALPGAALPPTSLMTADPVRATQHIYRVLLDALAHPGIAYPLIRHPHLALEAEPPHPWLASAALTMLDHETSLAAVPFPGHDALVDVIQRRTQVTMTAVEDADFVVAELASTPAELPLRMKRGTLDYPNDGATLLIGVDAAPGQNGHAIEITGPGIDGRGALPPSQLPLDLLAARNEAVADYPLGIDMFLFDREGHVIGLPRTTTVVIREGQG